MYDFIITNSCSKDFKKLDREAQEFIRYVCFPKILADPFIGKRLKGINFKGLFKFSAKFKSVDYRTIYQINISEVVVIFIMVSSREGVYKKLIKRIR